MDLKKLLPILAVVAVFAYGGWKIRKGLQNSVDQSNAKTQVDPSRVKRSLGEYIRQPRTDFKAVAEANPEIPKACIDYFDQLQKIDLLQFKQENFKVPYQVLPSPDSACVVVDEAYQAAEKAFMEKCILTNPSQSDVISEECAGSLFFMRAAVTRVLIKNKPMSEIKDLHQLSDLLFAEFIAKSTSSAPDFSRIHQVAARMLELNPNLYVAAKVSTFTEVAENMNNPAADWSKVDQSLKRAQNMNGSDPTMSDAEAAIRTEGFKGDKTVAYANSLLQKNPSDDRGAYLLALGQWKMNDKNASVQSLQRAIELNPKNTEYPRIMAEITQGNANSDSFKGSLSISVSGDDFDF